MSRLRINFTVLYILPIKGFNVFQVDKLSLKLFLYQNLSNTRERTSYNLKFINEKYDHWKSVKLQQAR